MNRKLQAYLVIGLLALLAAVIYFDPRVPRYASSYSPPATAEQVRKWYEDVQHWREAPSWAHFKEPDRLAAPDFQGSYIFGKYDYRFDVQIRGDRIQYISWGSDDQENGGAWFAVGEGHRQPNGEWFSIWSCLDISKPVSNGGGAWFRFDRDMNFVHVRYYHDTLPFGHRPREYGQAVRVDLKPNQEMPPDRESAIVLKDWRNRPLEGRVRLVDKIAHADDGSPYTLWGRVVDEQGRGVDGAAVKRRAAGEVETHTDSRGFFKLQLEKVESLTLITAGKLGYTNGIVTLEQDKAFSAIGPGRDGGKVALATITLREMERKDYRDYEWVSPEITLVRGPGGERRADYTPADALSCGNCHRRYHEHWQESRHATMATNPWTRASFETDAAPHARTTDGRDNCTPCHSPSLASKLDRFHVDGQTLLNADGVDLHGNHCDFCHKIEAVTNPQAAGMNGSIRLLRPNPHDERVPGGVKRVFGPLPDVSFLYMGAGYNPIFQTGTLCAGCHEHQEGAVAGQSTWSEWRQTKYARPGKDYQECQGCHMPQYAENGESVVAYGADGKPFVINRGGDLTDNEKRQGGAAIARNATRYRPLAETHKHSFVGTDSLPFLKQGVRMDVQSSRTAQGLRVTVTVENVGAGHAIPTGHGLKRYLVAVTGRANGEVIEVTGGLPAEERMGAAAEATTGLLIGRQLSGGAGGDWALPWWRAEGVHADNRLWPGKPRVFEFELPGADEASVQLILRRGSPALIASHGLDVSTGRVGHGELDTIVHRKTTRP